MSIRALLGLTPAPDSGRSDTPDDTATMQRIAAELEMLEPARARYVAAFALILGRVAHADSTFSEVETVKMVEIVRDLGHLTEAQAALAVEIAKAQVRLFGGTDNYLVTRRFKDIATPAQRVELLDCVFAVSAADESISVLEESQSDQIAKELGLSRDETIAARITYQDHLESVKQLRGARDAERAP